MVSHLVWEHNSVETNGTAKQSSGAKLHVEIRIHASVEVHDSEPCHVQSLDERSHREDLMGEAWEGSANEAWDV